MEAEDWQDLLDERLRSIEDDFEETLGEEPVRPSSFRSMRGGLRDVSQPTGGSSRHKSQRDMSEVIARAQQVREQIAQLVNLHEDSLRRRTTPKARTFDHPRAASSGLLTRDDLRSLGRDYVTHSVAGRHRQPRSVSGRDDPLKRAVLLLVLSELL